MGRPTDYSEALGATICERVALGQTLTAICDAEGMPDRTTVWRWSEANEAFRNAYARAKDARIERMADEILKIADECRIGEKRKTVVLRSGSGDDAKALPAEEVTTGDMVERSRLMIDARKWLLAKLAPKKYGERTVLAGDPDAPLTAPTIVIGGPPEPPDAIAGAAEPG